MSDSGDFMAMSDPDFLGERTRVREELRELTERFRLLNEEFDRRARAAWTLASQAAVSVLRATEMAWVAARLIAARCAGPRCAALGSAGRATAPGRG
jgi:hypothetical protein